MSLDSESIYTDSFRQNNPNIQIVQIQERRNATPPPSYHNITRAAYISECPSTSNQSPPSYEEVIDPNAPPPSYDSLFGRVREAHKSSKGVLDFLLNILILLLGTIGCSIILGITIVVPVCMIVIGFMYLHECPQGEYIPIYLLVGGCFGVVKQLLHLVTRVRVTAEEQEEERIRQGSTQTMLNCFMLGWFIIGSVWIYKEYVPSFDPSSPNYCHPTLYLFAFWLNTTVFATIAFITMCLCIISVISLIFHRDVI